MSGGRLEVLHGKLAALALARGVSGEDVFAVADLALSRIVDRDPCLARYAELLAAIDQVMAPKRARSGVRASDFVAA